LWLHFCAPSLYSDGGAIPTAVCQRALENFQDPGVSHDGLYFRCFFSQPTDLPLIGRVHGVPAERTWLHFYKWSKEFGPIYKHDLFGTTHVWISSDKIAKDILAKQGSIFSDRPLIDNLPINKTGGEYLPLLGENGRPN
jgi:hypothetical protein